MKFDEQHEIALLDPRKRKKKIFKILRQKEIEFQLHFRTQLIWRIDEFGRKMKEAKNGNTPTLFSPPFYTSRHGYRLAASLCLNGDGKGKGTHISAFISILKGSFILTLS